MDNFIQILNSVKPLQWLAKQIGGRWTWQAAYDYMVTATDRGEVIFPRLTTDLNLVGLAVALYTDTGREVYRRNEGDQSLPFGFHLVECADTLMIFDNEVTAMLASAKLPSTCIAVTAKPDADTLALLRSKRAVAVPSTPETLRQWQAWLGGIQMTAKFAKGDLNNDILYWLTQQPNLPIRQRRKLETDNEIVERIGIEVNQPKPDMAAIQALQAAIGSREGKLAAYAKRLREIEKFNATVDVAEADEEQPVFTPIQQAVSGYRFNYPKRGCAYGD